MLKNKVVIVTAGHRGGGAVVAARYSASGAQVVIIANKDATEEIVTKEKYLTLQVDFSNVNEIYAAIEKIIAQFGRIDILINNFSMFHFKATLETTPEEFNRITQNIFATFFFSQACIPYLQKSDNPHVINIAPPLDMESAKAACEHHLLFSIAKYGMSFCTMGMAEEFKKFGIAFNSLWQARPIATKTLNENFDNEVTRGSNKPEVYAEAAYLMSLKSAKEFTGNYCIDEDILREANIDLAQYAIDATATPVKDVFLPGANYDVLKKRHTAK